MRHALASFAVLALALLAPTSARAQEARGADLEAALVDVAARARERTVLIYGVIGLGSGAIVDPSGLVVTNAHVVAGARYALVQWPDGTTGLAKQRGIDYTRDLAVLEPVEDQPRRASFSLAIERPREGAWVLALGFPGGLQTTGSPTVSLGRVLGGEGEGNGPGGAVLDYSEALRHDAPIFSGNSGGPLVDLEGRLVGINGAVDLERAVSLTIPAEVVADRLETLEGGVIVLPGGRRLNPDENPLLRGLYRLLDPLARRLPEQIAEASRRLVEEEGALPRLPEALTPGEFDPETADRLALMARDSAREPILDGFMRAPGGTAAVALEGGRLATRVGPEHAVTKASFLPAGDSVALADGSRATVVARSEADDLALLRVSAGLSPAEAPHGPVGSLVQARDGAKVVASGIVSAAPRRASATLAAQIRSGGVPEAVERAIDSFEQLVERFGVEQLGELVEQLRRAIEQRRAFAAGTPPRGYAEVLAVDAPVRPSQMGAPILDDEGRLVGVAIGVQHFGTTYVVPMSRVREVFSGVLGGTSRWPERIGEAKLY